MSGIDYPFVSVIVLNYNGIRYLKDLFESLCKTTYPQKSYEVIMGDNASTDNSVSYTQNNFPFVKVLRFDKNYGFCKGNNLCVKHTRGQYLVFLNTDIVVTPDWLKTLVNSVRRDKDVIVAGAKLLKPCEANGKKIIDYAGGKITYEIGYYEGYGEPDSKEYSFRKYTGFGCGAAVIVERQFFVNIGGFDEYYFGGGEEVELGLRAWQYGYKVLYEPSSVIYHLRYGTFKRADPYPTYAWTKSMYYFIFKNFEKKNAFFYCWESIILTHLPKMFLFILNKELGMFQSVLKGNIDFLFELKSKKVLERILQARDQINKNSKKSDKALSELKITTTFKERLNYRVKMYTNWKSGRN